MAEETANLVAKSRKYKGGIIFDKSIYNVEILAVLKLLGGCSDAYNRILLIGHNPTVEEIIELLTGSPKIIMSTCALAQLTITIDKWTVINKKQVAKAKLVHLWNPKIPCKLGYFISSLKKNKIILTSYVIQDVMRRK